MAPSTSPTSMMMMMMMMSVMMMMMSVVAVLLPIFPVALALTRSELAVLGACKTVGGGSTYFDVQFCEDALSSIVGNSGDLDQPYFAGLVVGLLANNATSTKAKIDRLLQGGGGGGVARCLLSCQSMYGGILDGGPSCTAAVKAKKWSEATAILEKAAAAAKECEDRFGKNHVTSLLSAEDDDAFKLAKLGVALLNN